MALNTIIDDIITQLDTALELKVEGFPDNPREYKLLHPKGAVLVSFNNSSYTSPESFEFIQQIRTLEIGLTLIIKGLRDKNGAYAYLDLINTDNEQEIDQVLQAFEITGAMARVPLDVLAVLEGGTVTATGTGTTEIQTYDNVYTDIPNYFKLETQSTRVFASDGTPGDLHNLFHKCKITDMNYSIEDDFATIEFTARAVRTVYEGKIKSTIINETAAGIS
jgi:hypothetical protein